MIKRWSKKEIEILKDKYSYNKNKDLSKILNRPIKGISYIACKLKLKKDKEFYCKSRRHLAFEIKKDELIKLYLQEKNSIRDCAKRLNISKNTLDYYLKKFNIKSRNKSESRREALKKYGTWCTGLTKETDKRLKYRQEKIIETWEIKKQDKIKNIEIKFKMPLNQVLNYLYNNKKLTQEKIAQTLKLNRSKIIKLMRIYNIKPRINYEYIRSLKGEKHPMYGKTWETVYGIEGAKERRKFFSEFSRKMVIKRIENKEFPFFNTKIEINLAKEMEKRKILFINQFNVDNKFVCDFAIPFIKLIIECDGDYWHANPSIYNQKKLNKTQIRKIQVDKFKDKYLKERGWRVIRFYESDINNNLSKCVDQIEEIYKQNEISIR